MCTPFITSPFFTIRHESLKRVFLGVAVRLPPSKPCVSTPFCGCLAFPQPFDAGSNPLRCGLACFKLWHRSHTFMPSFKATLLPAVMLSLGGGAGDRSMGYYVLLCAILGFVLCYTMCKFSAGLKSPLQAKNCMQSNGNTWRRVAATNYEVIRRYFMCSDMRYVNRSFINICYITHTSF